MHSQEQQDLYGLNTDGVHLVRCSFTIVRRATCPAQAKGNTQHEPFFYCGVKCKCT